MTKEEEYRINAAQSVELAYRSTSAHEKGHMLKMAEAWLDLADMVHQQAIRRRRNVREHPLLRAIFERKRI